MVIQKHTCQVVLDMGIYCLLFLIVLSSGTWHAYYLSTAQDFAKKKAVKKFRYCKAVKGAATCRRPRPVSGNNLQALVYRAKFRYYGIL